MNPMTPTVELQHLLKSTSVGHTRGVQHDTSFDWHEPGLTIGQVAHRSGIAASAIRFYEAQGLISSDRTAGNQRRYHGDVMCRLAMIEACQRVGLTLAEVGEALAALPPGRPPTPQDWEALAERLRTEAQSRIDRLSQVLNELAPAP
ncbi:redox-sensitive transcriptional activator SoxR [Actinomadura sp. 6K520]|nr:redox-sensitive transcriptional activator SoxR [Actinomadura sp. 6K520]